MYEKKEIKPSKIQLHTNENKQEMKEHGSFGFPLLVSEEILSAYTAGAFLCHWHKEVEFTLIKEGQMLYQINDDTYLLSKGDALYCNTNVLHSGKSNGMQDCSYLSITFDPKLIYGFDKSQIHEKYVNPLLLSPSFSSLRMSSTIDWQKELLSHLESIHGITKKQMYGYEFDSLLHLLEIWRLLVCHIDLSNSSTNEKGKDLLRIKEILSFIEENYASKIELIDIAQHVHLCKSECCRLFKRIMHRSLFDYLLEFRIEKSLTYVMNPAFSITDAAILSGFSDSNYFSKVFHRQKGCSPLGYRKRVLHQ